MNHLGAGLPSTARGGRQVRPNDSSHAPCLASTSWPSRATDTVGDEASPRESPPLMPSWWNRQLNEYSAETNQPVLDRHRVAGLYC